jgi:hypothetical protein
MLCTDGSQQFASSGSLPAAPPYQSIDQVAQQGGVGMEQHQQEQQHSMNTQDQQYGYQQQY